MEIKHTSCMHAARVHSDVGSAIVGQAA